MSTPHNAGAEKAGISEAGMASVTLAERAAIVGARAMLTEIASGRLVTAERKDDFTFVLNLDLLSDAAVRKVIGAEHAIVSEEDPQSHALLGSTQPYFLVDPLDGTNNCRRALSFFGTELHPMQESFGPIVGYVENGIIQSASFVSLTELQVWTAVRGKGCTVTPLPTTLGESLPAIDSRPSVVTTLAPRLRECGVLFYPGKHGELELLNQLRSAELVDGCYRLGGFAGDCTRIARGREQILIQFSLKPWDLVAALIATEAGAVALSYSKTGDSKTAVHRLEALVAHPMAKVILVNSGCAAELESVLSQL